MISSIYDIPLLDEYLLINQDCCKTQHSKSKAPECYAFDSFYIVTSAVLNHEFRPTVII